MILEDRKMRYALLITLWIIGSSCFLLQMRELMRIKRSVMTAYDVQDTTVAAQALAVAGTHVSDR